MATRTVALLLIAALAVLQPVVGKVASKREPGFDGFGTPDPFNRNDDDEVDAGEPNAPEEHDSSDDANMVTEEQANAEDDDSFMQVKTKRAKKEPGFDGFGTPDPFNRNDDDEVDAGEPNAPEEHDSSDDANMVTEEQANAEDDDSFMQVAKQHTKKMSPLSFMQTASTLAKKEPGFDGFGTPDPFNRNDDDEVDAGEPNAPEEHDSSDDANMVTEEQANAEDDDSFMQVKAKRAKKEPGFDGFGTPDPFNRNDDDEVDAGEPNAPEEHDSSDDANMVTEEQANAEDDDSFMQVKSKRAKKEPGFDGFGTPDPFNRNDDDEVDAGEPNAPEEHDSSDDANMVTEEQANAEDDDSFIQSGSRKVQSKRFLAVASLHK